MDSIVIQESFADVINDVVDGKVQTESFWISIRPAGAVENESISEEYQIEVGKTNNVLELIPINRQLSFAQMSKHVFEVCKGEKHFHLRSPKNKYHLYDTSIANKKTTIYSVCISPHQEFAAFADSNGTINISEIETGKIRRSIEEAHVSDITKVSFFPSGLVLLSVGLDFQIKIWSVLDGSNPRSFYGHTSSITDSAMIGTGRNFLTSSRDGSLRLWECGSGSCIHEFRRVRALDDPVNCFVLTAAEPQGKKPISSLEFDTNGKFVFAGYQSGTIQQYSVADRTLGVSFPSLDGRAVTCIAGSPVLTNGYIVIAGYEDGVLRIWNVEDPDRPISEYKFDDSPLRGLLLEGEKVYLSLGSDSLLEYDLEDLKNGDFSNPVFLVGLTENSSVGTFAASANALLVGGKYGTLARY